MARRIKTDEELLDMLPKKNGKDQGSEIDLLGIGEVATPEPTFAEHLYAQRIAAGQTPELDKTDPVYSAGTQTAVARLRSDTKPQMPVAGELVESDGRDLVNQLIGQIQMANSFARFADVVSLQKLLHIKETKAYKHIADVKLLLPDGKVTTVGTWEGFCQALGMSVSKVDEDLINLRAFGEQALENLTRIGAGYRELRQWRKLPADQREALAQIAQTGSKDDVLEAAYDAIEKERQARGELETRNAELSEDLKAAERRGKNLDAEIERKDSQIKRLTSAKARCTDFLERTEDIRSESMALQAEAELPIVALKKLFDEINAESASIPEHRLQIEQVWITANVIAARAVELIDYMRDNAVLTDPLPDHIGGMHILTPEEARRWLLDFPMIENRHAAEAANRQEKRDAAKPRGPGRPKGAANKGAGE
jgi:hypothetical protein